MKLKIDPEILSQATACPRGHMCQRRGEKPCCPIEEVVNNAVFFTADQRPFACAYQHGFGGAYLCACPARAEIHRKHRA